MEELLLLLSLEDTFTLLAAFIGGVASIRCVRCCLIPQKRPRQGDLADAYQPSVHIGMVETYPVDAWLSLRSRTFRRKQHIDSESEDDDLLLAQAV